MVNLKVLVLLIVLLAVTVAAYFVVTEIRKSASDDPTVWEDDIVAMEKRLAANPAKTGAVIFIGSSSIRLWDSLAEDMQPFEVVQRGFGGAKLLDVVHYADRLIDVGVAPSAIVVFVGSNDVQPGFDINPELLLQRYQEFIQTVRSRYEKIPVYFIAITPSILRWEVWSEAQQTNQLIAEYVDGNDNLFFIETSQDLMGENGEPDSDLYMLDGLHLSKAGYAKWTAIIQPRLVADLIPDA